MRRLLAAFVLLLAPSLVEGQYARPLELLAGKRIRAKLAGPEGPWAYGFVREASGDSLTMGFANTGTAIRMRTADLTVQRSDGYNSGRGMARGALIGGLGTIFLMAATPDFRGEGLQTMLYFVFPPVGALLGAGVGFATASERWASVSDGTLACGGWRNLDANAPNTPIVTKGARNRKRGALIGAAVLGGIGLVGGLTDPELPRGDVPGIVVGNALFGAAVGALLGPREKLVIPASCP
jgi:hypothetical protein